LLVIVTSPAHQHHVVPIHLRDVEKKYKDSLVVHVPDVSSIKPGSIELLFKINDLDAMFTNPNDETKFFRIPSDFKLVFFGTVGVFTRTLFLFEHIICVNHLLSTLRP